MEYTQFRNEVFLEITDIINKSNCSTFKIMGYKYLDIKLILNYSDCTEVINFKLINDKKEVSSFYTKDFVGEEELNEVRKFVSQWSEYLPENH